MTDELVPPSPDKGHEKEDPGAHELAHGQPIASYCMFIANNLIRII
jgi:hypothetical protein